MSYKELRLRGEVEDQEDHVSWFRGLGFRSLGFRV